jgi:O-antigen/teichoic acid export membrane protein
VLGYVLLACLGTLASQGFLQGTQLLAEGFATPTEVGYFATAVTLVMPMYFLPRALGVALFPTMARAHGAGDVGLVRRQADLFTRTLLVVLAPLFAVGVLLSREVLVLFYGPRYVGGEAVLQLYLAATFLAVCAVAAVNALSSGAGWQVRTPVVSAVAGVLTGLAVVALLGRPLGAAGVGIGYLAGTAVTAAGPVVTVWRRHAMAWRTPVLTALGVVAGAVALGALLRALDVSPGTRLALDVGGALLVAVASVGLLAGQMREIFNVARNARLSSDSGLAS